MQRHDKWEKAKEAVEKLRQKVEEDQQKLKEAEEYLKEVEQQDVMTSVGKYQVTPEQLAQMLEMVAAGKLPGMALEAVPEPEAKPARKRRKKAVEDDKVDLNENPDNDTKEEVDDEKEENTKLWND